MDILCFFNELLKINARGNATEHSYRTVLQKLFDSINSDVRSQNEPKRLTDVGAPDFSFHRGDVVIGHCEAKDLVIDLKSYIAKTGKEQFNRYRKALPNLIYTNGLTFLFYKNGELRHEVTIGEQMMGWHAIPDAFEVLEHALKDFAAQRPQTIRSPATLAKLMAGKAVLIKDILGKSLSADIKAENSCGLTDILGQYKAFKEQLLHDIKPDEFADIYAETIAYGMFAARLHDDTPSDFTREEALYLLPKSNPFLRALFGYIAGPTLDDRLVWVIDELAEIFRATDMGKVMAGFGSLTKRQDPFIHFYEDFLSEYNPAKRKSRGVWYTPEPVVKFIVRAVDEILQTEFGLPLGLADTSKITVPKWDTGETDKKGQPVTIRKELHRVQILDPATGTGTFLAEAIVRIAEKIQGMASGKWSGYVEDSLIPRLHGFELLMASYAMCHMKLDIVLTELGYKPIKAPRLGVYLTNSLEEGERDVRDLFMAQWLTREAREANTIKRQMPIMCVIGNPPYSGVSQNMGNWINELIEDYKYVDGVHFGERKHWLHDDYVKFIRLSESLIEKTGEGILGFITNHGYLDNPTFRGMRWHLMKTFDKIYVLDLHGNTNKKESTPEGKSDKNVFDIQQGVAILIAVKKRTQEKVLAEIFHGELWGTRQAKQDALLQNTIGSTLFKRVESQAPQFAFIPRDHALASIYNGYFSLDEFMPANVTGIVTAKDDLVIDFSHGELEERICRFTDPAKSDAQIRTEFFPSKKVGKYPPGDSRGWKLPAARTALRAAKWENDIQKIAYRPLDVRWILYRPDMVDWGRFNFMHNMIAGENLGLIVPKIQKRPGCGIATNLICGHKTYDAFDSNSLFPLYLYPTEKDLDQSRRINFDSKLWKKLRSKVRSAEHGAPDEVAIFDYIYGVLHCPAYRETYAEYLKVDFPRIPWPASPDEFWDIVQKGRQLRCLHLMQPEAIGATPYPFTGEGDDIVDKVRFEGSRIWINDSQGFDDAPAATWEFWIGGYQPAQKWLKDRKGRELSIEDIHYYQRILKILSKTHQIMSTITITLAPDSTKKKDADQR
ncbi:N-6 DNA methylase [Gluconobacter cerinus]|uniref:type ISP restriction/modification enzyme n=1 Tax=Gluconobacter cerinus TaxID=38307 RepID=UPI001B8AC3FF|nr:type ISP restriction/modification enzyme [Gluconobacter cerinus]MBS1072508.1 N-6 DNA methylase [Gluconobacter cerinus]